MRPQDVKYHTCPRCKEQAIVLVDIMDNAIFYRDDMGDIQYRCTNCCTTFSVDSKGNITVIQLGL